MFVTRILILFSNESLSAYLAEATGNKTYLNAANSTATFTQRQLFSSEVDVIYNGIDLADCSRFQSRGTTQFLSFNTGSALQGLAILNSIPETQGVWTDL